MKSVAVALLAFAVLTQGVPGAQSRSARPIAHISVQRILTESSDGIANSKKLEAARQDKTRELNEKAKALEVTKADLSKASGILNATRRAELQEQERQQQADLQRATQQAQTELQEMQRQNQAGLRSKLGAVVAELAARRGIQVVLNAETAIIWAPPENDLTSDVLERLNATK
jgi:Skp family chaperone for outer membrane proteins